MKDIGTTPAQPEQTTADHAVAHLLRRVRHDPRLAYHMFMTETLSLAMRAHAEANGLDPAQFRKDYEAGIQTEEPRRESVEDSLLAALQTFIDQWNACGPNSDFGRHFRNVRDAAVAAIARATGKE